MDSSDVMFGIIVLGFVLSGMTARAKYRELKRGRKPSEKAALLPLPRRADRRVLRIHNRQSLNWSPAAHDEHLMRFERDDFRLKKSPVFHWIVRC